MKTAVSQLLYQRVLTESRDPQKARAAYLEFTVGWVKFAKLAMTTEPLGQPTILTRKGLNRSIEQFNQLDAHLWTFVLSEVIRAVLRDVTVSRDAIDVGCGHGRTFWHVFGVPIRYGADVYDGAMERIPEIGHYDEAAAIDKETGRISVEDASLSEVVCLNTIYHVSRRREFLKECHRILRPGGMVIVNDLPRSYPLPAERTFFRTLTEAGLGGLAKEMASHRENIYGNAQGDPRGYSLSSNPEIIAEEGFRVVRREKFFNRPLFDRLNFYTDSLTYMRVDDLSVYREICTTTMVELIRFLECNSYAMRNDRELVEQNDGAFEMFVLEKAP